MKKCIYLFASTLLILITLLAGTSCKESPNNSIPTDLPTTKVTPREGDLVQVSSALMPNLSLEDVMRESETAFIGTVKEIFPSQQGAYKESGEKVIYTDVAIVPERYLFGGSNLSPQIIRVYGGRVGNIVAITEDEPTFTVNEHVLVFVSRFSSTVSVSGNTSSYLRVDGSFLGKYCIEGDTAVQDETNRTEKLAKIETLASSIKR